ncbi:Crp/Fnr family transcriptional regulator [Caldicellulosiruptor morganii]|uniref:Crp/Fnr family transcriptional regulator n=1 Tax=Caldicellulosiruptor morganii TaxID=1387555 RepID=A0ABY7BMW1_9FIRM|nr:Crp/Fnr family transcriptional regulator [Caldicellulosiruptor morganii]WAM33075.1 Crp/Fnr family transcriptional regulator [Caldicellulosiruptor morganii]
MNYSKLSETKLFRGIEKSSIERLLSDCNVVQKSFEKDEIIVFEGDECTSIGIILEGLVDIKKVLSSGKEYTITTLYPGDTFGEAVIFSSSNTFPAMVIAKCRTVILFLSKESIINLSKKSERFLYNFLNILSDRILLLNSKLKESTFITLRQKICNFLLEEYKKQKSFKIKLPLSKYELAEKFNVQRPSLSRELIKMREEGLIDFWGKEIWIKNLEKIEDYLFESS